MEQEDIVYQDRIIIGNSVLNARIILIPVPDLDGKRFRIEISGLSKNEPTYRKEVDASGSLLSSPNISEDDLVRYLVQFREQLPSKLTSDDLYIFQYPHLDHSDKLLMIGRLLNTYFRIYPNEDLDIEVLRNSALIPFFEIISLLEFYASNDVIEFTSKTQDKIRSRPEWFRMLHTTMDLLQRQSQQSIAERVEESDQESSYGESFTYDVYLNCDVSVGESAIDFFNAHSREIRLVNKGYTNLSWQGNSPFSIQSIFRLPDAASDSAAFPLILTSVPFSRPYLLNTKIAVISTQVFGPLMKIEPSLYLTYFIAISVLDHEVMEGTGILGDSWTPGGPYAVETSIRDGYIPSHLLEALDKLILIDAKLMGVRTSAESVMAAVRKRFTGDTNSTNSDHDNSPQTGTSQVDTDIQHSAKIASFEIGRYGAYSDQGGDKDLLEYNDYASALADLVTDNATETPISIGICAPWGRGKSKLLDLIKSRINSIANTQTAKNTQLRCKVIEFDAWRYSKTENIWAGFINTVLRTIERDLGFRQRLRLAVKLNTKADIPLIRNLIILTIFSIIGFFIVFRIISFPLWVVFLITLSGLATLSYWKGLFKLISHPMTQRILNLASMPKYESYIEPIHKIMEDLQIIVSKHRTASGFQRLVVIIDDIDRCDPRGIMDVLESIKHFLQIKEMVFIIAMDTKVVRKAVGNHYKFMGDNKTLCDEMGDYYLEKMIQFNFHLPMIKAAMRDSMANELMNRFITQHEQLELKPEHVGEPITLKDKPAVGPPPVTEGIIRIDNSNHLEPVSLPVTPETDPTSINQIDTIDAKELQLDKVNILPDEKEWVRNCLGLEGLDISPRLIKRFINIYMIARHLLITKARKDPAQFDGGRGPSKVFAGWLLLNVRFPKVSASLYKWFESSEWNDNLLGSAYFDLEANYIWTKHEEGAFADIEKLKLIDYVVLYKDLQIVPNAVRYSKDIIACFNPYLE